MYNKKMPWIISKASLTRRSNCKNSIILYLIEKLCGSLTPLVGSTFLLFEESFASI